MKIQRHSLLFLFVIVCSATLAAQCPPGQRELRLEIQPDQYLNEISWTVTTYNGTQIATGNCTSQNLLVVNYCVDTGACSYFNIFDSYGDGLIEGGFYRLFLDNELIYQSNGSYGYGQSNSVGCPVGASCESAFDVAVGGPYQTLVDARTWYKFTPDSNGIYVVGTCLPENTCATKIWVYEECGGLNVENNLGTLYYASSGCDSTSGLAKATLFLEGGKPYFIRIGYANPLECTNIPVTFDLTYSGPIVGCTDPNSCNYNPLATVLDTCYYYPSSNCTNLPDLIVRQDVLLNSFSLGYMNNADACAVEEGCLRGFGPRNLIEFTTQIQNIGEADYFIGQTPLSVETPSNQFVWDPCHQHWHYLGYADYILYNSAGARLPIGSKTGFCVLDLECQNGGQAKYTCNNMGVTAGCGDIYDKGLPCQWVDITDLPADTYTFVMRVNWDKSPDKLGRVEKTYDNNWAQACFTLAYGANGSPEVELVNDCPVYTDCLGIQFGDAQPDCEGNCGGTAVLGDWTKDTLRANDDVTAYLTAAMMDTSSVTACRDLYEDGHLDVYDAALLHECVTYADDPQHWVNSFPCQFPGGTTNPDDIVYMLPGNLDTVARTFDIEMVNPFNRMVGYQIEVKGLDISSVENLAVGFDANIQFSGNRIVALASSTTSIKKNILPTNVLRIRYNEMTDTKVCLDSIIAVVNEKYHRAESLLPDPNCITVVTSSTSDPREQGQFSVLALPNPAAGDIRLFFANPDLMQTEVMLTDVHGRVVRRFEGVRAESFTLARRNLPAGIYQFTVRNAAGQATGRVIWQ